MGGSNVKNKIVSRIACLRMDRIELQKRREEYLLKLQKMTGFDHKLMKIPDYIALSENNNEDMILHGNKKNISKEVNYTNSSNNGNNQIFMISNRSKSIKSNIIRDEQNIDQSYFEYSQPRKDIEK